MLGGHLNFNFNLYSSSCILSVIGATTMTNNLMIWHKHLVISLFNYLYVLNHQLTGMDEEAGTIMNGRDYKMILAV